MKVPQFMPWVGQEELDEVAKCFRDNWLTEGPRAREFQENLLKLIGAKHGVFAPNGTLGLFLALKAIGVGPGDEVIVPDFTFIASAMAVEMVGARPVFVDVNTRNFQIDLRNADHLVRKSTKAIMPVHIYGTAADMDSVNTFAKKHGIKIIEDAAQALGVHYHGRHAGTFGDVGVFSFFADKTITTAEGSFVVTNDEATYESLLYLRNVGRRDRGSFIHPRVGYNLRMTDIQCAIGLVQLKKLDQIIQKKAHIAALYKKLLLADPGLKFFEPEPGVDWIPFRVGILSERAQELMKMMRDAEIETRTFFFPLHRQPAFNYLKQGEDASMYDDRHFPNAIYGYECGICLPSFPTITDNQIRFVCETINKFYE